MAVDTAEKRRSVGGVPYLPLGVNVTPNVAKDVQWRQQAAWSYSGIAPAPPTPSSGGEPTSPIQTTAIQASAIQRSAIQTSALGSAFGFWLANFGGPRVQVR